MSRSSPVVSYILAQLYISALQCSFVWEKNNLVDLYGVILYLNVTETYNREMEWRTRGTNNR